MRASVDAFVMKMAAWGAALALVVAGAIADERAAWADSTPIVYSRCPRGGKPFTVSGPVTKGGVTNTATVTVKSGELREMLPDTARPLGSFTAPCDLVYRDGKGAERILYSCIAEAKNDQACAALDAAVSFDAKTVAFSVFRGKLVRLRGSGVPKDLDPAAENTASFTFDLPGSELDASEAQIVLVDIATGKQTAIDAPPGTFNFGPAWLSNGRLAFSSALRYQHYAPMPSCANNSAPAIQLYAMDVDGRNVERISPHGLGSELHPLQLTDGRISLSSWQLFGMLAYRHGNSFGGCGTLSNFFHMYAQYPDGANATALYGQHLSDPTTFEYSDAKGPHIGTHMAAHFFGQSSDGRVWTTEYYRGNNLGLGALLGFPIPPQGQEGPSAAEAEAAKMSPYRAWDEVHVARWASSSDQVAALMPAPALSLPGYKDPIKYAGKVGHPSGLPGNRLLISWAVGACSLNTGKPDLTAINDYAAETGDNPFCDVGIYETPDIGTSTIDHPSVLTEVVNSPDYQEFLARPVVPYKDVFGMEQPKVMPRAELASDAALEHGTPFGVIGASSIIHRETKAYAPISYEWIRPAYQGTDTIDYSDDELCGVRILAVQPNRKVESYHPSHSTVGERVEIVGEFPVRKNDGAGNPITDKLGAPDTSFRVKVPSAFPYLMQAIDCEGRTLNTDQTWQSLRPGEVKTCNGCHVHSAAATKLPYETSWAASPGATTHELGTGKVQLLTGGSGAAVTTKSIDGYAYAIEFERDVMPIFAKRCVSCHGAAKSDAGLRLDIARVFHQVPTPGADDSTYFRLAMDESQSFVPAGLQRTGTHGLNLGKPNLSRYVRMMNSRASLLYWKAKGARTDNRTDAQFGDDVDFGAAHPTTMTADELGVLARWIDTGCGWGPEFTQDTIDPTLHVVGVASGGTITALKIGTVDVGDGIDPDSLSVCIVDAPGGTCGPNLAGKAEPAGVTTIPLATALTSPDAEVWAKVKDRAGNLTEERYTVRFLLNLPPPALGSPANDGGVGEGANADANANPNGDATDGTGSGCGCRVAGHDVPMGKMFAGVGVLAMAALIRRKKARS